MPRLWTLPREAMAALEEAARQRFQKQMRSRLSKAFPDRARELGEAEFAAAVARGIGEALDYGITAERDIEGFLHLYFQADLDPGSRWPWAEETLARPELSGSAKVEFMQRMME